MSHEFVEDASAGLLSCVRVADLKELEVRLKCQLKEYLDALARKSIS